MRSARKFVAGAAALSLCAAPSALAGTPSGNGLWSHSSDCTSGSGEMTMVPGLGATTFWMDGTHYLVQHVDWPQYQENKTFGAKTGLMGGGTITCSGNVAGTDIVSTDVAVP